MLKKYPNFPDISFFLKYTTNGLIRKEECYVYFFITLQRSFITPFFRGNKYLDKENKVKVSVVQLFYSIFLSVIL